MLGQDMFGHYRFYVMGNKEKIKDFTIDLTWYHSALAEIGSVVEDQFSGDITLNIIVKDPEREDYLRKMATKFGVVGFSSFKELKAMGA